MDTIKRLEELAKERKLSTAAIARRSGINPSTINAARSRGGQLSVNTIETLCAGLGISLEKFFGIQDDN